MPMEDSKYQQLKEKASRYIWNELEPMAEEIDKTARIPKAELWPKFRDHGFFGLVVPQEYGGSGLSVEQYIWFEKEWAKLQGGIRVILHVHSLGADIVAHFGNQEQKQDLLPRVATGETSVAFALTERNAGTGKDIKTEAIRKGDKFVLNGEKHLITNADFAQYFNVVCRTENGWSNIMVEKDTPGFVIKDMPECMGCHGSYHGILEFENCEVPQENLMGTEGRGMEAAIEALRTSRIYIAANALGVCERCLESSIKRAKERVTFGKPIAKRQSIQADIADMSTQVYYLRHAVEDAARDVDQTGKPGMKADMAKLFAFDVLRDVSDKAMLIHGGLGYTRTFAIERMYRDCRLNWLEEGTPTIHKLEIARELLAREDLSAGVSYTL
ncbi:MAG: acyl-CoA dehydrogenase family protein [Desulfobacteraceae bacterium]|nr:acyl-CoA dehydrogenase family protein [Desulfobacteraceae bacterium]